MRLEFKQVAARVGRLSSFHEIATPQPSIPLRHRDPSADGRGDLVRPCTGQRDCYNPRRGLVPMGSLWDKDGMGAVIVIPLYESLIPSPRSPPPPMQIAGAHMLFLCRKSGHHIHPCRIPINFSMTLLIASGLSFPIRYRIMWPSAVKIRFGRMLLVCFREPVSKAVWSICIA